MSEKPHAERQMTIVKGDRKAHFFTPNETTAWRVRTIATKEPITLKWVLNFKQDEILVDVGANVGMYTILAAAVQQARVYAFEPEARNFYILNENIHLNQCWDRVIAYPAGLLDIDGPTELFLSDAKIGTSCHTLDENVDYRLNPRPANTVRQGATAWRLDSLVARQTIPVPNHLKIDVDGLERRVLAGAVETLKRPELRDVLIELSLDLPDHRAAKEMLEAAGFAFNPEQLEQARRKEGPFNGFGEILFQRISA